MAFQRIRLQSFAPLPVLRVWFLIPQDISDIKSLKHAISTHLPPLKDLDTRPAQLILEVDDFELLDDCSIDLVHEGDILMVKSREPAVPDRPKRKANVESAKRRRLSISSRDSSIVSSSTSDSSSTESSDSTSDSSSTDSSDSVSSSTSNHPVEPKSNRAQKALVHSNYKDARSNGVLSVLQSHAASRDGTSSIQQANVPPGYGKPSTHSRNKRRKLKRKYAAAQSSSQKEQPGKSDRLNGEEIPFTGRNGVLQSSMQSSVQPTLPADVSIPSYPSVAHSPRGIVSRRAMKSPVLQKLNFDASIVTTTSPTLVPPSEREDLPKNLLVTSVEIDWRRSQGRSNRHGGNMKTDTLAREDIHSVQGLDPNILDCIDWTAIETSWDKHKTLDPSMELLPDAIVAWKAFGLDPISLTPQASMLHLGRVVSVDTGHVLVQPLTRQNIGRASFGRASVGDQDELADQILNPLKEVWSNGWKLISQNNTEAEF